MKAIRTAFFSLTACALLFALFGSGVSFAADFSAPARNLSFGDSGPDVLALQQLLNQFSSTRVAQSGPGSPGAETDYFGSLTLSAVDRFQEKYESAVLLPVGLSAPTGFVGPSTRKELALVAASLNAEAVSNAPAASSQEAAPSQGTSGSQSAPGVSKLFPVSGIGTQSPVLLPPSQSEASGENGQGSSAPAASSSVNNAEADSGAASAPVILTRNYQAPPGVNPNSVNLGYFINEVDAIAEKQNYSASDIARMNSAIRTEAASSTDFSKEFYKSWGGVATQKPSGLSAMADAWFTKVLAFVGLAPEAKAATPATLPFGGALLYALPCICSANWLIGVEPLPPTYVHLLTYYTGTQAFLSYNIPATTELLGEYTPGVGICLQPGTPCWPMPAEGMITPMVGSSPV